MWVDDDGSMHTVWMPSEEVLGRESVAALRAVPDAVAQAALDALDAAYAEVVDAVRPHAPAGPAELDEDTLDGIPSPPVIPGLAPQPGEGLATTVLRFLDAVPPIWRLEVLEAVSDVLDRTPADPDPES